MELDLDEPEPPVLDYARFYGLCKDYTLDSTFPTLTDELPDDIFEEELAASLPGLDSNPAVDLLRKERLGICKEAACLLKETLGLRSTFPEAGVSVSEWSGRCASKLKQEVSLLYVDAELDTVGFDKSQVLSFDQLDLPMAEVDAENDECLNWPMSYQKFPKIWQEKVEKERLPITKDTLVWMQEMLRDDGTPARNEKIMRDILHNPTRRSQHLISPPLLPSSPKWAPYIPSSPDNHIPLPSDSTDSVAAELKDLNGVIMQAAGLQTPSTEEEKGSDDILFENFDPTDAYAAETQIIATNTQNPKRKATDLKVEGPLTPPILSDSPSKKLKSISFSALPHESDQSSILCTKHRMEKDSISSDGSLRLFRASMEHAAARFTKRLARERLLEADTTKRVEVPFVDFDLPIAPWEEYSNDLATHPPNNTTPLQTQRAFLCRIKHDDLKSYSSWHGISKLDRELPSRILPSCRAPLTIEEKLHGQKQLDDMLAEVKNAPMANSSTDMWVRSRLKLFELDDDENDELELADFPKRVDDQDPADNHFHKASNSLEKRSSKAKFPVVNASVEKANYPDGGRQKTQIEADPRRQTSRIVDNGLMFGGTFSASAALEHFMSLHGKGDNSARSPKADVDIAMAKMTPRPAPRSNLKESKDHQDVSVQLRGHRLELPDLPTNLPRCSFIMSSTLLQRRKLAREIQKLYEIAEIIERDFNVPHSPEAEPDLILSPSTGLILTTLQQIKQQPLPGQPDRSPLKQRLSHLDRRYERLIVMVSEGLKDTAENVGVSRPIDSRDEQAIKIFKEFTSELEAECIVDFVRGGEMFLSRAVVKQMAAWGLQHGSKDIGDLKLLQDESTWEIFLRRAGLNPFAAQVIIASLKDPGKIAFDSDTSAPCSQETAKLTYVPAFVHMSAEERIRRFQTLLGGSRVLYRANALLDQRWLSATNGFRI